MKKSLLTTLRDKHTATEEFRKSAHKLAQLLASDIASHIEEKTKKIKTPFKKTIGYFPNETTVLVPILRSGMALLPAFIDYFEKAKIGILGIKRDEKTATPSQYYANFPKITSNDHVIILDPMLATGQTAELAIKTILHSGAEESNILFVGLVAAKKSLKKLKKSFSKVTFHIVSPDEELSDDFWIIPGLGDFGDRFYDTQ